MMVRLAASEIFLPKRLVRLQVTTQLPIQWVPMFLSPGVKHPGHEANHSPPSVVEVKMDIGTAFNHNKLYQSCEYTVVLYGSTDIIVNVIYCDGMNFYKNIEVRNEWSFTYTPHTHTYTHTHTTLWRGQRQLCLLSHLHKMGPKGQLPRYLNVKFLMMGTQQPTERFCVSSKMATEKVRSTF